MHRVSIASVGLLLIGLVAMVPFGQASAACSVYKNLATINEVHRSGNATRFIEVKLLDSGLDASVYDGWTVSACSVAGCTGDISLSAADDTGLPYVVIEKALISSQWYINLTSAILGGSDYLLKDSAGNTIDYFGVNDFHTRWWGWNAQYDADCAPAFDWTFAGTNTHTVAREPDGTGDWSDAAGASGGETQSSSNDSGTAPDGGALPVLSTADVTVAAGSPAGFVVSLSGAPKAYDVSFDYYTVDNTAEAGTDYTATSGTASITAGDAQTVIEVPTLGGSVGGVGFYFFIVNPFNATIVSHVADGNIDATAGLDHFVILHDGLGISCMAEGPISVSAKQADGSDYTGYTGSIVLDTQSGTGSWSLLSGSGSFSDPTAGDGLATYTFDAADNGVASFSLDYQSGAGSIDVDAYDGAISDDDTEGTLVFSPSGFTVTASALTNPPSLPIDLSIPAQTAASDFNLHLTAYGQTPTDATCGVIESYDGVQSIGFWSTYMNPLSGTQTMTVNGAAIAVSQAARVAQNVSFVQGQAQITVNYADVGSMALAMRDDTTGNPDLPTGIFGTSQSFVVKPAGFVLSDIRRTSDAFPNPGTAVDESGAAFMAAGDNFSVTVTAVNALGNTTPNYGQESTPESVALTSTLVAAGAANNPAVGFATGFASFVNGVATGNDFHWDEVGIITLTPQVAPTAAEITAGNPGSYLGAGDVVGTVTGNVGRFYPDHFVTVVTAASNGSFANTCTTAAAFTYLGESFGYLSNPSLDAIAMSVVNAPTVNYTGAWARLDNAGVSLSYPSADNSQLDDSGLAPLAVMSTVGSLARTDNADGSLTFTLGGAGADSFAYVRDAGQVMPFTSNLTIVLTAVDDGEASAADLSPPKAITPIGNLQRFGRGYAQDVHGTMSQAGDSLVMPIGSWFYNASGVWTQNTDDSCSSYAYTKTDAGITTTIPPASASPLTLAGGVGSLTLSISADAGNPGGTSVVNSVWPSWLQYDVDGVDQLLDGNSYDDDFSATATFGIFRGDDRYLYWREAP